MPRKKPSPSPSAAADDEAQEAFQQDLRDIGRNLPHELGEVEGADVREVVRHQEGEETDEKRIKRELAEPHADLETEMTKELDL